MYLSILIAVFSFPVWALAESTCQAYEHPAFAAAFEWKAQNGAVHKMSVRLAMDAQKKISGAQIYSSGQCLAVCQVKEAPASEIGRTIASITPRQIDLDCSAADFAALTGPATLIFRGVGIEGPMIRFGTWLDGYREADLRVRADRLEPRSVQRISRGVNRSPAIAQLELR